MNVEATVEAINTGVRKKTQKYRSLYRKKTYDDPDPEGCNFRKPCSHKEKSKFKCHAFTLDDVIANRRELYKFTTKIDQDRFLTRFTGPYEPVKRGKSTSRSKSRNRQISCRYFLKRNKKMVPVSLKYFLKALGVGQKRIKNLNKTIIAGGIPKENRGGDRKSSKTQAKKDSLRNFIKGLPASESHYTRNKSKRIYLDSELNAKKLRKFYNDTVSQELQVSRTMFHKIFTREFNIGFKQPATDACNVCVLWNNRIKRGTDATTKQKLITEKRVHKLRANAFYTHMKTEVPKSVSFCFDMQKVQPLPKTPIQDAYYSRQVSFYNACMVGLDSRKPTFYIWHECDFGRGAVEVGSALYDFLNNVDFSADVQLLRLFCDGCGGQNKNSHIVHLLMFWLVNKAPTNLKEIHLFYPVRGHSYLPADRVLARVEKEIRKTEVITTKEDYYSIYEKHGDLKKLGSDWFLHDIKGFEEQYKKLSGIQAFKRIVIRKSGRMGCNIQAYENFRYESGSEAIQTLLKKGKRQPTILTLQSGQKGLPAAKKNDVINLLKKQFGDDWVDLPELSWYKEILLSERNTINVEEAHDCEMEDCHCMEPDIGELRV